MEIIVNTKKVEVSDDTHKMTYRHLCDLAGKKGNPTLTYHTKYGSNGTLTEGERIVISEGTIINCVHTDNS